MTFNTELQKYVDENKFNDASKLVLQELGKLMSKSKSEFVYFFRRELNMFLEMYIIRKHR